MINDTSLGIILRQYKSDSITEEEAIRLIEDLTNTNNYIPIFPSWPQITYTTPDTTPSWKRWEITCKL